MSDKKRLTFSSSIVELTNDETSAGLQNDHSLSFGYASDPEAKHCRSVASAEVIANAQWPPVGGIHTLLSVLLFTPSLQPSVSSH